MSAVNVLPTRSGRVAGDPEAEQHLARMRAATIGADSRRLLEFAIREEFAGRIAVISSFAAESAVLLHQVASIDPDTPILFLNTGKLFAETLRYRDHLQDLLGLTDIRSIGPNPQDRERLDPAGTLWSRDADACCHIRKVLPVQKATAPFAAIITGRKRFQTEERAGMHPIELFGSRFRFNPLANWSLAELTDYIQQHRIPLHPLAEDGFTSIGCIPCTRRTTPDEDYRAGRWSGLSKRECGIHTGVDGEGI